MADYYLNQLGSKLPAVQGRQIMRLLQKKKLSGEFRTVDQVKDKLKQLTDALLEKRIKPTIKLWIANGKEDISSEKFNDMMERIEDDLEAAFLEADNLYDILNAHNALIKEVALRGLESGLNRLEAQLAIYEFLIHTNSGYDDALFNTFRNSNGSLVDRDSRIAKFAFVDHRTNPPSIISPAKNAVVDIIGERLVMAPKEEIYITPAGAEHLAGSNSTRSELAAYFEDVDILNIIDNTTGTYWAIPILLQSPAPNGVYAEIAVKLPGIQDITFVEVEPATGKPLILSSLKYIDGANQLRTITSTAATLNKERTRINFNTVKASQIILQFQQKNYTEVQFKQAYSSNTSKVLSRTKKYTRPAVINNDDEVAAAISNPFIERDLLGISEQTFEGRRFNEYIVALDNIKVGRAQYQDVSVFVSDKKAVKNLKHLALRVDETRPTETLGEVGISISDFTYPAQTDDEDAKFYHGSVEYVADIEFTNENGELELTAVVPLLPLNASRIYHERVVFTHTITTTSLLRDAGALRFFCDADGGDVIVYKNGLPLSHGVHWTFVADGHSTGLTVVSPNSGTRMKRGIQLVSRERQSDIYTVSYTPKMSTTHLVPASTSSLLSVVDMTGDLGIRLTPNGTIICDTGRISSSITGANVYLSVIMRQNSTNDKITPALEEFLLAVGSGDLDKFKQ